MAIESSIEQGFPARNSKFLSSIEQNPLLESNSKISIEQWSSQDSTRFEFDRTEGSARLELEMFDKKSTVRREGHLQSLYRILKLCDI